MKRKLLKKFLFICCMICVAFAFSAGVSADIIDSGTCGDNLTWSLDSSGTLTISGSGAMTDWDYSNSAPWYYYRSSIKMVKIESGVTSIGHYAFYDYSGNSGYSSITSITIPDSVTSIGNYAFQDCSSLTSITIPNSVTSIGNYAFSGCTGLTSITIPDGVMTIGDCAFYGCTGLTSITIPDGVMTIGGGAFDGCTGLTSITIPDGVMTIGNGAFKYCSKLKSIIIPNSVMSIGFETFYCCTSLSSVTIGNNVTSIGAEAFYGCTNLKKITIPDNVESVGGYAFGDCISLTNIMIPDSVTSIGVDAFAGCKALKTVYYAGTKEQWSQIDIVKNGNSSLLKAEIIFYNKEYPFNDVKKSDFFYNAVYWAFHQNPRITSGTDVIHFSPASTCTRGQVVTFLWRAMGEPEPETTQNPFSDIKKSDFFYKAVLWAVENDVTSGTGNGKFSPNASCTRGQVVTFLWRAEDQPEPQTTKNPFKDVKSDQYYYKAVLWAVENGITTGTSSTTFSPAATCTRGQVVTFLYRDLAE